MVQMDDLKWAFRTFRECPYYPWEIFTAHGRSNRFRRMSNRRAAAVDASCRTLGIVVPSAWDTVDKEQMFEVVVEKPYTMNGFEPSGTVLDIGAKYGEFAVLCSLNPGTKKVFSFEPLPSNFKKMKELVEANGNRVVPVGVALGDQPGEIEAGVDRDRRGKMLSMFGPGHGLRIEVRTLDSYGFEDVGLMKIDVEGFEMSVLRGALNTIRESHPRIVIEVHSRDLKRQVDDLLVGLGYRKISENKKGKGTEKGMDLLQVVFYMPADSSVG